MHCVKIINNLGASVAAQRAWPPLATRASHIGILGGVPAAPHPVQLPGNMRGNAWVLGPSAAMQDTTVEFLLLTSAWPKPICWGVNQSVNYMQIKRHVMFYEGLGCR